MNEELDFVKKEGWILSESGLKTIDLNSTSKKNITKVLLDRDLREIGAGINDLHKGKFENIEHESVVLQILKIRNISAPKSNESSKTAPKLLKLQLTDGINTYSAIEMEPIEKLTLETKPGTKISVKVKQLKNSNGQLLLTPKNMEILGGYVEALVSKWEISRSLATQMKGNRSGAAPPFIPFGQKIQQNLPNDRSFKSLQQNKQKEGEENSEFNAQRQDAIAEATKSGTRKTFGGGNKTLVDSNVQKIMDKGYTEEQANTALKFAKNNVEKALSNLKRRDERQQQRANSHDYDTRENSRDYNSKRGGKGGNSNSDLPPAKPSSGVSLFDFLENKISETTSTTNTTAKQSSSSYAHNSTSSSNKYDHSNHHHNERFENNISSSFRKHDKENSNKSQQWSQYSSSNEQKSSQNYQKNSYNSRNNDYRSNNSKYESKYDKYDNHDSGSKEYSSRDYNRKYDKDSRDNGGYSREHNNRGESRYHQSSNYSSNKPNAGSSSGNSYSKSSHVINQKPSSSSSAAIVAATTSFTSNSTSNVVNNGGNNNNTSSYNNHHSANRGKYGGGGRDGGQKSEYNASNNNYRDGGKMSSKDYNNKYDSYSSSSGANNNSNNNYNSSNKSSRPNHVNNNSSSSNMSHHHQHHHHQQQSHSSDMYHKSQRNITESMEKMSLKGNSSSHHQQSYKSYESSYDSKSSSYPPLTSTSNESKPNFSKQQSNNYPIVGFQNKEANEQAKNALKTKNIPGNVAPQQTWQQAPQQQAPPVPVPVPVISQATIKAPFPPNNTVPPQPTQPQAMHSIQPPQTFVQHQVMHAMPQPAVLTASNPPPTVFHAAPITYPNAIIMQSVQPPPIQQVPQQLKVGDLCLAKYWEDGKFYNAKITGVSDSTYVVLFTDYGNAEEVRKNDCLPLISVPSVPTCPTPPQPITNFVQAPQMGSYRISSQQKMPPQHNYHSQQGMPYKASAGKNPRRN